MAPYITPWSVIASAGMSSSAARATMAGMRLAPSSSEYSVWLWRWTKVLGACGIVLAWVWRTPRIVYRPQAPLGFEVMARTAQPSLAHGPAEGAHSGIREISNQALLTPGAIRLDVGQPNFPT